MNNTVITMFEVEETIKTLKKIKGNCMTKTNPPCDKCECFRHRVPDGWMCSIDLVIEDLEYYYENKFDVM